MGSATDSAAQRATRSAGDSGQTPTPAPGAGVLNVATALGAAAVRAPAGGAKRGEPSGETSGITSGVTTGVTLHGTITTSAPPGDTTVVPRGPAAESRNASAIARSENLPRPRPTALAADRQPADQMSCATFTEAKFASVNDGVGDAVVYLLGVAGAASSKAPMRATLTLDDCRISPRVVHLAAGGTILVNSHDRIMTRIRFTDVAPPHALRGTIRTNDGGQVVPNGQIAQQPGIVSVRDSLHPWIQAWLAVAPSPYVTVTSAGGQFTIDDVPPGEYSLVIWHPSFETVVKRVTVDAHGAAALSLRLSPPPR